MQPVMAASEVEQKYAWAPLPSREQQLSALGSEEFDVLVIGGGATGAGVAFDSVSRGRLDSRLYNHYVIYCWQFSKVFLAFKKHKHNIVLKTS